MHATFCILLNVCGHMQKAKGKSYFAHSSNCDKPLCCPHGLAHYCAGLTKTNNYSVIVLEQLLSETNLDHAGKKHVLIQHDTHFAFGKHYHAAMLPMQHGTGLLTLDGSLGGPTWPQ